MAETVLTADDLRLADEMSQLYGAKSKEIGFIPPEIPPAFSRWSLFCHPEGSSLGRPSLQRQPNDGPTVWALTVLVSIFVAIAIPNHHALGYF